MLTLLVAAACVFWLWRCKQDEPRRIAIHALDIFTAALHTGDSHTLLQTVVIPTAIQGRTAPEQTEFLTKALRDEISADGLAVLQRKGAFGPLTNIFPAEAQAWAVQAGVKPEDCVAFKLEQNGLCAEVVLARDAGIQNPESGTQNRLRIVRCNNVKQLAAVTQP